MPFPAIGRFSCGRELISRIDSFAGSSQAQAKNLGLFYLLKTSTLVPIKMTMVALVEGQAIRTRALFGSIPRHSLHEEAPIRIERKRDRKTLGRTPLV